MDEDVFWRLAGKLGREPADAAFDTLVTQLTRLPQAEITGFADRLAWVLWSLDTPAHHEAAGAPGDDWFLSVRCAVVAAGRKGYERVVRRPAALARYADEEAEPLLGVAERAFERVTGRLWEHETPVSPEMGSNVAAWGTAPPGADRRARPWLTLRLVIGARPPAAFSILLHEVVDLAAADPAWQDWWAASGLRECVLSLLLDRQSTEATVRAGQVRARVDLAHDAGPYPIGDRAALAEHATVEIQNMLAAARARLALAELPPLSVPVGDDLPDESFAAPRDEPDLPLGLFDLLAAPEPGQPPSWVR